MSSLLRCSRAYERFLTEHKRADMAAVYEEALKHPTGPPFSLQDCWTELPDTHWSPLQRKLIESMRGERFRPHAFKLSGVSVPRRFMSRKT